MTEIIEIQSPEEIYNSQAEVKKDNNEVQDVLLSGIGKIRGLWGFDLEESKPLFFPACRQAGVKMG